MIKIDLNSIKSIKDCIKFLHFAICKNVRETISSQISESKVLSKSKGKGDVSYFLDIKAENIITSFFNKAIFDGTITVVSEGIGCKTYKKGDFSSAKITIIVDPIDGTREIMYDKRSAWVLTGIIMNSNNNTLKDIDVAIQTEIPPTKQKYFSYLYAIRKQGAFEEIWNADDFDMVRKPRKISASKSTVLQDGFVSFVNFFPGSKAEIAEITELFFENSIGRVGENNALVFDDQYISTGGQIYLLATGKYRMIVDIRSLLEKYMASKNKALGLCAHPYDLCTFLLCQEAGGVISRVSGDKFDISLNTDINVDWIGFSNQELFDKYQGLLWDIIKKYLTHKSTSLGILSSHVSNSL